MLRHFYGTYLSIYLCRCMCSLDPLNFSLQESGARGGDFPVRVRVSSFFFAGRLLCKCSVEADCIRGGFGLHRYNLGGGGFS